MVGTCFYCLNGLKDDQPLLSKICIFISSIQRVKQIFTLLTMLLILSISYMDIFALLCNFAVDIWMHFINAFKNELAKCLKKASLNACNSSICAMIPSYIHEYENCAKVS